MKLTRIIAAIGFYIARIIAWLYVATGFYILISVVLKLPSLKFLANNRFAICYPFTSKYFILGSAFNFMYITEMVLLILFYGLFFWLLSNVFKTFRQKKLFTVAGVNNLKSFYIFNLFVCPVIFLFLLCFSTEDYPYIAMIIAHGIMGIFAVFIAAIFSQGVHLQQDQDLFI